MPIRPWRLLAALLTLAAAARPATAQGDCSFHETVRAAVLSNSRVEIRLDPASGVVTGLRNKETGTEYLGTGPHEVFRIVYATSEFHGAPADDPWSATTGTLVRGSRQLAVSMRFEKTPGGGRLEVAYDRLRLERRTIGVAVRYTIELRDGDEETRWRLFVRNGDEGTVREAHFPLLSGLERFEALLMPNESGQLLRDPAGRLSDDVPVVSLEYPGRGSMQWFEVHSAAAGLYMASYDRSLDYTLLSFGRTGDDPATGMWIVKYPFAAKGTSWESPELAVGPHAGSWHWGADRYRAWLETWVSKADVPPKVREMIGGLREIGIKAPDGRVLNRYEAMVEMARQVRASPRGVAFMAAGWMFDGHDTYFPEYVPIPELGGERALVAAVDEVHEQGVAVTAYVNGRLANVETATYKKHGKRWSVLGAAPGLGVAGTDFFELHEGWNKSWDQAKRGEGWFAVMCPSVRGWQDHLVAEVSRVVGQYRFDGVFLDQPGSYYGELCHNPAHGHATPASAWGPGLLELVRRLRTEMRRLDPDSILWTEGMNDAFGQHMDYFMDKNPLWRPMRIHPDSETFVEMWRYTRPDAILVNDPSTYSFPPSHDPVHGLKYAFVLGVRGLTRSPERGLERPATGDAEDAARREVVQRLERLWIAGGEYLFHGRFLDDVGLRVSETGVLAKLYRGPAGIAVPLWNTRPEPVTFDVWVDLDSAGWRHGAAVRASSLDSGARWPVEGPGRRVKVTLTLPPHEVDVLVLDTSRDRGLEPLPAPIAGAR
jgi:hypothetical protein